LTASTLAKCRSEWISGGALYVEVPGITKPDLGQGNKDERRREPIPAAMIRIRKGARGRTRFMLLAAIPLSVAGVFGTTALAAASPPPDHVFQVAHRYGDELLLWTTGSDNPPTPRWTSSPISSNVRAGDEAAEDKLRARYDAELRPGRFVTRHSPYGDPAVIEELVQPN